MTISLHAFFDELSKVASITILTGGMGAGKTTMSNKLAPHFDSVYHKDIGGVVGGKWTAPPKAEKKRIRAQTIKDILKDHHAGKKVLFEGGPGAILHKHPEVVQQAEKVFHLKRTLHASRKSVTQRAHQRGEVDPNVGVGRLNESYARDLQSAKELGRQVGHYKAITRRTPIKTILK